MTEHHQPIDAALVPRFAGLSTFMCLPAAESAAEIDIALIGVPFDGGTTNRAGARHGLVGLILFDARSDTKDTHFGDNPYTRGLPFSRAIEDRIFDPPRTVQMGLRGSIYTAGKHDCPREQGIRLIYIDEVAARGIASVMDEAIDLTDGRPTYLTFDIGSLDPFTAVGTRAPEIRVLTTGEAQFMLRRLSVVRIIGAEVVEVAPPFDPGGLTALTRATMMFEILCAVAPGVAARR